MRCIEGKTFHVIRSTTGQGCVFTHDRSTTFVLTTVLDSLNSKIIGGTHQGSALDRLLFIYLFFYSATRTLSERPPFSLLYADDIALLADTRSDLQCEVDSQYRKEI
ncbi:hypothetical protein Y032_1005g3368 [Ancylostoma ceylanicum]|uniref:Reverse transcriptase domain-containing protein n=1 Tax=Ancylostoma ceylanicum TaxID=53326 RepID=A0A016W743_9BILA|nr:hypothetical protein Y032_1005g3368 [Ancylostoma ceylanicum]